MDVNIAGDPGFKSQGHGFRSYGSGAVNCLFFQRIKRFDFKFDFV